MTKKEFKTKCDFGHVYGKGARRINAIYVDWKSDERGRGFKYAVAASVENCTKAELFNHLYNWIENNVYLPYYIYSRFAQYDNQRFKVPITFNPKTWN
jgi:hypothetical protein